MDLSILTVFCKTSVVQLLIKQLLTKKKTPPHPSTQQDKKKVSLLSQLCFMSLFFFVNFIHGILSLDMIKVSITSRRYL